MKEIFPLCATTLDPEKILLQKDHSPKESTLQAKAFVKSINAHGSDKNYAIQEIQHGVVRRTKKTE